MDEMHQSKDSHSWLIKINIHGFRAILWDLHVLNKTQNDNTGMEPWDSINSFMTFPGLTSSTLTKNKDRLGWWSQRSGSLATPSNIVSSSLCNNDVLFLTVKTLETSWCFIFDLLTRCYYLLFNYYPLPPLCGKYSQMTELWQSPYSHHSTLLSENTYSKKLPYRPHPHQVKCFV